MCKYKQISNEQRIQLELLLKQKKSKTEIAKQIGVHRSAVYREVNRNGLKRGGYSSRFAQEIADERKERFMVPRKLTEKIKKFITEHLEQEWSPEQINGYCKKWNIPIVSHETIYQFIYQDKKQGGCLFKKLRIASKPYRKRYGKYDHRGKIPNRISIEQRPEAVQNKLRYGDWEADTIIGKNHQGAILTLVERKSYFTLMTKLENKQAQLTKRHLINLLAPYKEKVLTITADNGHEFTEHQAIAKKLNADFYFTHPYSAWEKGINENTNGLIRQYIPKKTDFKEISIEQLKLFESRLNNRPRKSLNWKTPLQVFMSNFENPTVALDT